MGSTRSVVRLHRAARVFAVTVWDYANRGVLQTLGGHTIQGSSVLGPTALDSRRQPR